MLACQSMRVSSLASRPRSSGHSVSNAWYTLRSPSTLAPGAGVRIDHGMKAGLAISPFYDPMIAKVIVHDRDRTSALRRMAALGIHATLFSNHMYYWGDFHRAHTFGAFRAAAEGWDGSDPLRPL